jgi:hypothetical protein
MLTKAEKAELRKKFEFIPFGIRRYFGKAVATTPPPNGFLIDLLVPPERAEDMLLHLDEAFLRWVVKYGHRRAHRMYRLQSIGAVAGFWIEWVRQRLDLFKWFA